MNQSGSYSVSKKELENADNQFFLLPESSKNGITITPKSITRTGSASTNFVDRHSVEPVRLTPAWEDNNLTNDELNFKHLTMDVADFEQNPPKDRRNLVLIIMIIYGIGMLMPWNMFINARGYFVDHKLSEAYTGIQSPYATYFLSYVGFASQIPNLIFNWINLFTQLGGDITKRIVYSILIDVIIFVITIIFAMIDTSKWPALFFWITIISVVILNMANGIFQNTVYGLAAKLPAKYSGAILLGANISGTFVSLMDIFSVLAASSDRTAAIYYFITALVVLLACFDIFFALPLNRFFRYYDIMSQKEQKKGKSRLVPKKVPHWKVFKKNFPQMFNLFFLFFTTLSVFPDMISGVKKSDPNFFVPDLFYSRLLGFLTFNFTALIGSIMSHWVKWPQPQYLFIIIAFRGLLIPFFFFCKFEPVNTERNIPVIINNDYIFWFAVAITGLSAGYFSCLALMYKNETLEPIEIQTAGMFAGAMIISGVFCGVMFGSLFPFLIKLKQA